MRKIKSKKTMPIALLIAAAVLLLASTVGSTQAALTYHSENYMAEVKVSNIDVVLLENDQEVEESLLESIPSEGDSFKLGKAYDEQISVRNSGAIDAYVRVILTKSWQKDGKKNTTLSPKLIELNEVTGNGWEEDESASTDERTVLYYKNILKAGEKTPICTDTLRVNPSIGNRVKQTIHTDANGYQTISYEYEYDGFTFNIEAEVQAVQTHNAKDAIKSAWGVGVTVDEKGIISLVKETPTE